VNEYLRLAATERSTTDDVQTDKAEKGDAPQSVVQSRARYFTPVQRDFSTAVQTKQKVQLRRNSGQLTDLKVRTFCLTPTPADD